ncbi:MAG: outer membrane protein assembly factor BamA [Gammaproteobacteria bacterium]|nr:outer membrane protein assembly factor BamA [Gammaproteobacteria bacterium]
MGKGREWITTTIICFSLLLGTCAYAQTEFTVGEIDIRGTDRISVGTVLNYLPVRVGDTVTPRDVSAAIRALYETGLFHDVTVGRRGDSFIVTVKERPAIAAVEVEGNTLLEDEQLDDSLSQLGIERGRVFNASVLEKIQQELQRLYFSQGYYAMTLKTSLEELERNRVAINIEIFEGENARIRHIKIIGNNQFPDDELLDLLESGVAGMFQFLSSAHEYSRAKLSGDLETLRSFYQDRGFVRFEIVSTQVSISADKRDIYITINIDEGEVYSVENIRLSGQYPVSEEELRERILIKQGDIFSRKRMSESASNMASVIEEQGYAFANVNVVPKIDDEKRLVHLTFVVEPGKRAYVRRIEFLGNSKTRDIVFRRELRQFEGGWYSPKRVSRSRVRIQRLRFIESVSVDTVRVPGTEDQIDLQFTIKERPAGSLSLGLGFSSSQGLLFNIGVSQENLFGTGNRIALSLDNSATRRQLSFSHTNPYFTENGVSRSFNVFARETDATEISTTSDYLTDSYGGSMSFGIPLSEFTTVRLGGGFENTQVFETESTPLHIEEFIDKYGDIYDLLNITSSVVRDTRNRTTFPERGNKHLVSLEATLPGSDLEYYKLGYDYEFFYPLNARRLVFSFRTDLDGGNGYGDLDELPFFEKYFTGGIRSLRGYAAFSLGPRDSNGNTKGGDFRSIFTTEVIFPPPWAEDVASTRFSLFIDMGNVYEDVGSFDKDELRASAGVSFNWFSPIGPLTFSLAEALNDQPGDETESFQFAIGTLF